MRTFQNWFLLHKFILEDEIEIHVKQIPEIVIAMPCVGTVGGAMERIIGAKSGTSKKTQRGKQKGKRDMP
jgi:hypothetical protein